MKGASDEQILFPDVEVEGYAIRPWTLAQAVALAPTLGSLVEIAKESGVGEVIWKSMDLLDPARGDTRDASAKAQKEVLSVLPGLIPKFLPHAPKIIGATIRPILFDAQGLAIGVDPAAEAEAAKLNLGKATVLLLSIVSQNVDYLKNFFGPGATRLSKAS